MTDQRNLILAIVLSIGIILAFQFFYEVPRMERVQQQEQLDRTRTTPTPGDTTTTGDAVTPSPSVPGSAPIQSPEISREQVLSQGTRVEINNARVHGSFSVEGARIDNITLADYRVTTDPNSPEIVLLTPPGTPHTYFAQFGWIPTDASLPVPTKDTAWQTREAELSPDTPVSMQWDNGAGLSFSRQLALDPNYMFTMTRQITNQSDQAVTLYPYGLISRWGTPTTAGFFVLHEGPIGVFDETLKEIDYSDLADDGDQQFISNGGWIGFTDKYWLTALIPSEPAETTFNFKYVPENNQPRYQLEMVGGAVTIQPGETFETVDRMFAGAKEVHLLDAYRDTFAIPLFDRAVDFGWFYFLTKPIFYLLDWLHQMVGNYGVAILLLTLIVKLIFFPLANKSYKAMSKMKALQPEMKKMRERYGDDRAKMNQELMALYKKEKVNPMAGCLPIVIQIPVFFALYKVLLVSIEMRHAPFFGWITDLSAPDPTTIFNLFGIIPFDPPSFLMIGVWPVLMGLTMYLQQKLNPAPADPTQARIMMLLPFMFVFLFATFPAGLVVYWTWNNVLSISQQWVIMRRMGVKA
ncbi:MAG: membrane protein insertase YidC [Pseudomonadota bacterium]